MKRLAKNIRVFEGIVAFLFLLSSSGFSVAVHSCLMEDRSCCDRMMERGSMEMLPPSVSLQQNSPSCCQTSVAGGLNGVQALAERQSLMEIVKTIEVVLPGHDAVAYSSPGISLYYLSSLSQSPSPPSEEKYLLNSSLLI